ncbi:MAG: hypothetical protein AAF725_22665 [Acidobacteriota bacterium]
MGTLVERSRLHPSHESLHGTVVPVGYSGPVGQLKIDAYPWGKLVSLKREGQPLEVPGSSSAPLVLLLAPGSYEVLLEEGASCRVEVTQGGVHTCRRVIRTIDAQTYYQEVGW